MGGYGEAVKKAQHSYQHKGFGCIHTTFLNYPKMDSQEQQELLASRLLRSLWTMPLNLIVLSFWATLNTDFMNEHMFDNDF